MEKTFEDILWNLRWEFAHADLTPERESEIRVMLEDLDQELCELNYYHAQQISDYSNCR